MTTSYIGDFRAKTTLGVALTCVFFLTPFSIYQIAVESNIQIGVISFVIVCIFAINAWNCLKGQYNYRLTFLILAPVIIFYLAYAFATVGSISMFWCYPAVLSFYFMLPEKQAWVANFLFVAIVTPQAWDVLGFEYSIRFLVTLSMVIIFSGLFVRIIDRQQSKLEGLALFDPLTGLLNRTSLRETLDHAISQSERLGLPATLIMLDLDHFKSINDDYGHSIGDTVLRDVAKHLGERIRHSDKVFRLGGEEFLIVLYNTETQSAIEVAEELRNGVSMLSTLLDRTLTASIGLATHLPGEGMDEWLKRCDDMLYKAKYAGRNKVIFQ